MDREELLDKYKDPIKVGFSGHVRLIDVMGDDSAIVQAARVSYGAGTKTVREDRGLIRYLMKHRHTSPIEQCEIKFHVKMPIHVARQWIRHRTASLNEVSTRYSEVQDEFELIDSIDLRLQSSNNKQGSSGYLYADNPELATELSTYFHRSIDQSYDCYQGMIQHNIAREQARNVLPLATYTEMYWKCDLHNLFHFLKLRLDSRAQLEIREFAQAMATIVQDWCPIAYEAFEDYSLNAVTMSAQEMAALRFLQQNPTYSVSDCDLESFGLSKREAKEFIEKLNG